MYFHTVLMCLVFGTAWTQTRHVHHRYCPMITLNICNDPVSNQPPNQSEPPDMATFNRGDVLDLLSDTQNAIANLTAETGLFEDKHLSCPAGRTPIQQLDVSHMMHTHLCSPNANRNHVTVMYAEIAEAVHIFKTLTQVDTARCCLFSNSNKLQTLYSRLRNRIVAKWYTLYSYLGTPMQQGTSCFVRAQLRSCHTLRCEDIRNLVYVVFRHTLRRLQASKELLETEI